MEADIFTNGHHDQAEPTEAHAVTDSEPSQPPAPEPPSAHGEEEAGLTEAAAELDAVEAALGRLEDGSFDRCEICGGPVGQERLLQDPLLTRCPQHAGQG